MQVEDGQFATLETLRNDPDRCEHDRIGNSRDLRPEADRIEGNRRYEQPFVQVGMAGRRKIAEEFDELARQRGTDQPVGEDVSQDQALPSGQRVVGAGDP